nr:ferritin-2, chloroplastic [Tanacetum cinerariifolium]
MSTRRYRLCDKDSLIADKYVSVDFVLLEKVSGGRSSLSESIDNFNRNICDLENCSFRNHLLASRSKSSKVNTHVSMVKAKPSYTVRGSLRSPVKRKMEHAEKFMGYQVKLQSVLMSSSEFDHAKKGDALYAMELALSLEKLTNEKLLHVHAVEAIKNISEYVAQLRRVGKGHGGYGTVYKAWRKEDGRTCYLEVLLSKVMERFRACPDLWDPWILKETAKYVENQVQNVGANWSATSIDWEISDNDEENCERMTMQEVSGVTECESKREHDGKIFDMIVDTSIASPAASNTIIPVKKRDGFSDDFASCFSHINVVADDMSGDYVSGIDVDVNVRRPFAMAQAAYDGLQLEDQIVKFRDVDYGDNLLPKFASEAQKNQGRPILMLVMKQGTSINLVFKPRTWRHRCLLG